MRGKFYTDPADVDRMEEKLCELQDAVDVVGDLPITAMMNKAIGQIEALIRQLHEMNFERLEPKRPDDDRVAQALGWPERY